MQNNKIRLHALGGAGTNITKYIQANIVKEGICDIEYNFLDASDDLDVKQVVGNCVKVKSEQIKGVINGSGGVRSTNVAAIKETVETYCNTLIKDGSAIDVIIMSGSGGSGSTIGNILIKDLLERGHAVYLLLINDATNDLYASNTLSTLATLSKVSKALNKNIVISDYTNESTKDKPYLMSMGINNEKMKTHIECLAFMFAGGHEDMDTKDVIGMFDTSGYPDMPSGLLFNTLHHGDVQGNYALARILIDTKTFDVATPLPKARHTGMGTVREENRELFNSITNDGNLVMVLESNKLAGKFDAIAEEAKRLKDNILRDEVEPDGLDGFADLDI